MGGVKVYVLESGSRDQSDILGVYTTVEAAITADPGEWTNEGDDLWRKDSEIAYEASIIRGFELHVGGEQADMQFLARREAARYRSDLDSLADT